MKLILAQGNPGTEYAETRHNIGFTVLETIAAAQDADFTTKSKFFARIAEVQIDGEKVILALPTTYYNETGRSARAIVDFYKLEPSTDVLVVHDDLAIDFGLVRTRARGGDAGNNGIKSINSSIGEHYHRIRIGIASERKGMIPDADFVLSRFSKDESSSLDEIIKKATDHIDDFVQNSLQITTT